jgi:hypothetical protein
MSAPAMFAHPRWRHVPNGAHRYVCREQTQLSATPEK